MGVKRSGINEIDALLKNKYWNKVGQPVSLTYSYDTTGKDGLDRDQRRMIREALTRWEQVANIDFKWVAKGGNLRFSTQGGTGPDFSPLP
jgi:serralysin